ncbi:MAG: type IV pilus assembly protein PilQ [Porticoccaceae bacterium]|jgi:type IV pilus assembly protein PilQ|tara:strand:+ start:1284 stop:3020 length:1737 start_codon:yes stop_codon:yes gene_type:complete
MKIRFIKGLMMRDFKIMLFTFSLLFSIATPVLSNEQSKVEGVEFGVDGKGHARITVSLTSLPVDIDITEINNRIVVVLKNSELSSDLDRRLDVSDFATPVKYIDTQQKASHVVMEITNRKLVTYSSEREDGKLILLISDKIIKTAQQRSVDKSLFKGDLLDLNFQDIEVRDVLELIADFKSLNLVASDSVQGTITLNLNKVPWDQALDIIMRSKGLDMRKQGNILLIAPIEEIAEREQKEIESKKKLEELAPLETYVARVKYAEAKEIYKFFNAPRAQANGSGQQRAGGGGGQGSTFSILSERGSAIVDERTNTIILTDIGDKIDEFKRLLARIDIPVKQVLIEARIVKAESDFRKELGASWGLAGSDQVDFSLGNSTSGTLQGILATDLGISDPGAAFSLSYLSNNLLIDLELSALESGGFGEIVSQPKVLTADKKKASIKSGVEIPYQAVTNNGDAAGAVVETQFKEAVLQLEVTPQITPDNRVIMDILVKQDSVGSFTVNGEPAINVTEISTQALVGNGQTLVLGGIFQSEELTGDQKVPILGDLPLVGNLFKKQMRTRDKREILIFITPKIIDN